MLSFKSKIKIIPIDQPFLRILARYICNKFKNNLPDFSEILMIFPSQRNKFYFRRYLLEVSDNSGIIPPSMRTISELLEDIYEALGGRRGTLLNKIERNFILKGTVDALKVEFWRDLPFLRFISIGNRLLGFFDELAKERVALEEIEEKVLSGHYPERYVRNELPIIKKIYKKYKENLKTQQCQDEMVKYDTLDTRLSLNVLKSYKYICVAGLVATTKVESNVMKEILENFPAELILHSSPNDVLKMTNTSAPFYLHFKLLNSIGVTESDDITVRDGPPVSPPVYHIKKTETESQQTFYLRDVLMKLKGRYEPHRIAVILTDESMVYAISETLLADGFQYNVSVGFPFTQSILYSFLNQLKGVVENKFHYKEIFSFIRHPLVKNAVVDNKELRPLIYCLESKMIEEKLNYFYLDNDYGKDFIPLVTLIKECVDAIIAQLPLHEYIDGISHMLNSILLYNKEFMKTGSLDINEFFDRLHELAKLRVPGQSLGLGMKMLEFILRVLKDETFNLQGDPMKGVQVIGLLEARNLDFDCIIIPSMNEGIFPKRSEKDLFVNQLIRQQTGLPYDKERESLYYYYFKEMASGKKEVYISYIQEEKRDVRSRFIDFLGEQGTFIDESKIALQNITIKLPRRKVKKESRVMNQIYKLVSGKGLSPTALRDYKTCPYGFYIKHILGICEPEDISEEAGPLEWGRAMHRALNNFYKYDFPAGFMEKDLKKANTVLSERLTNALERELAQVPRKVNFLDLEIYKKRMARFLIHELDRFNAGYMIDKTKLEKSLRDTITISNRKIKVFGFTDRVDILNGKYYIIDYKSTAPPKTKYQIGDDFVEFQLPLYAMISSDGDFGKVCGMAYYELSTKVRIVEIAKAEAVVQYLKGFKEKILIPTIEELLSPAKPFYQTDNHDACVYCEYKHLCGIKDV